MRHKLIGLATLMVAVVTLSACGSDQPPADGSPTATITAATESAASESGNEAPAAAGDCDGEFVGGSVDDDITISDGNILIHSGGELLATDITIDGNIQGDGHASVEVRDSQVDGNIQLESGQVATIENVRLDGDLQSEHNSGPQEFTGNAIDGNLQCEANRPAPTGGDNTVEGDKEGQCTKL